MSIARRDFLKTLGAASCAGTLGGWRQAAAALTADEALQAFRFADDRVPMNAANLCPMPASITDAVERFSRELERDMSAGNRHRIEGMKEDARRGLAVLLNCKADELAIVRNTSEANSVVVRGVPLGDGDEILLWDQNHPSNALAWDVRAARDGFRVRRLSVPRDTGSIDEVVDYFVAALSPQTRLVSFTHISNVTGFRLPAAEICGALRRRRPELFIHVDGAQTWGVHDIDLGRVDCDTFSGSAHKWFMGPRETGLLFVRERRIPQLTANVVSIPWGGTTEPSVAGARKFEALGQRDDAAIAALAETVSLHAALTPAGVRRRADGIADELRAALADLDLPFVSSRHPDFTSNVVILAAKPGEQRDLPQRIFERSGIITAATGGLRMSPHIYNTPDHVRRVASALAAERTSFTGG
ncbi:MAG TPA: aminotransferase class V-fold PLP-dependent enzyme [Woeseiaceae bacterium]|nr:aminotransferase class V-fold PLP-dependent enzyme [Woeseiaceae bacterium]